MRFTQEESNEQNNRQWHFQEYTNRGHVPPELSLLGIDDFLELTYKPYRIIYQVIEKVVFIHCVLDGRRDMQKLLQERLMRE